jgi:predicted AlkP superfamily pyrophosphatase or phosphodiesterase
LDDFTRKVLFIGIDGMRADAAIAADTPHLDELASEGAWTDSASTQLTAATVSAPGWASITTGVEAEKHGIIANGEYDGRAEDTPSFLWRCRQQLALETAVAAHWPDIISPIHESDAISESVLRTDDGVTEWLVEAIEDALFDVHFAHLDDVDAAGHDSGFSTENPDYLSAIEAQDARVGLLLDAIQARLSTEEWLVVVTTDHGGEGTSHGALNDANQTIPFWVWGAGVVPEVLPGETNHMDVHPTVMRFLGMEPEKEWQLDGVPRGVSEQ